MNMKTDTDENDDLKWFDALTGHVSANATDLTEAERQGLLLREALLEEDKEQQAPDDNNPQAEYERLLFRLKREGALDRNKQENATASPAKASAPSSLWRLSFPRAIAAAIAVAIIVPITYQITSTTSTTGDGITTPIARTPQVFENPMPKAALSELTIIRSVNPDQTVENIIQGLQRLNINNTAFMLNGKWHIEANVGSATASPELSQLAQQHGFVIPDNGEINIRIEAQQ